VDRRWLQELVRQRERTRHQPLAGHHLRLSVPDTAFRSCPAPHTQGAHAHTGAPVSAGSRLSRSPPLTVAHFGCHDRRSRDTQPWRAGAASARAQALTVWRRAHGGACGSARHAAANRPPPGSGLARRCVPRSPTPERRRLLVVTISLREGEEQNPSGWGDSAPTRRASWASSCSAHTEAQPRPRSPTRHDASRSVRVRWRPRSTLGGHAQQPQRGVAALHRAHRIAGVCGQALIGGPATPPSAVVGLVRSGLSDGKNRFAADLVLTHHRAHVGVIAQVVCHRNGEARPSLRAARPGSVPGGCYLPRNAFAR
jgi:hypothetical protein